MLIKKVELENIKSCLGLKEYEFSEGTIAITGENGAGKSTIIEAIGWVLFDFLEYKQSDFVTRGKKKGVARVTIVSNQDGREYVIERDTDSGYNVYDLELRLRRASGKAEVTNFLHYHFNLDRSISPSMLFQCAVGVPQGTFTSDFLKTASERKPIFDKLLKVQEYKEAAERLRETRGYAEKVLNEVRNKIAYAEGQLTHFEEVKKQHQQIEIYVKELSEALQELDKQIAEKRRVVEALDEKEKEIKDLESRHKELNLELSKEKHLLEEKRAELERALEARRKVEETRRDYERHKEIEKQLEILRTKLSERNEIRKERESLQNQMNELKSKREILKRDLQEISLAEEKIKSLEPKVSKQIELEQNLENLRSKVASKREVEKQIKNYEKKLERLRSDYEQKKREKNDLERKIQAVGLDLNALNKDYEELTKQLARLQAELEMDRKFRDEIKNGFCPILSQRCLNLREGETLESFLEIRFSDLKVQIQTIEAKRLDVQSKVELAQKMEAEKARLESLEKRLSEIKDEGQSLKQEKEKLEQSLQEINALEPEFTKIQNELSELGNPLAEVNLLKERAEKKSEVLSKLSKLEGKISAEQAKIDKLQQRLVAFEGLDDEWNKLSEEQKRTAKGYQEFLANKSLAENVDELKNRVEATEMRLKSLKENVSQLETELKEISKDYDSALHENEKCRLRSLEDERIRKESEFRAAKDREAELKRQIEDFEAIFEQLKRDRVEAEKLEKLYEHILFIRETLNNAGPAVAEGFVRKISSVASQIFQEITSDFSMSLRWTNDYEIIIEEKGHERPFKTLSGGEQMAAALSVRLALLEQLSDVRVAFFDEPTMNMDEARRRSLAEQISIITESKRFNQIFVISHDDTFESKADAVIRVEKTK